MRDRLFGHGLQSFYAIIFSNQVKKPFEALKHKIVMLRMNLKKFHLWAEKDLWGKVVMRTHVEIVTFFTNNDPVKVFAEMAEQNPANKTPEMQEEIKTGRKLLPLYLYKLNLCESFSIDFN